MPTCIQNYEQSLTVHPDAVLPALPSGDLWVFGYGSLMWRTEFPFLEAVDSRIFGYHRSLCVSSEVHRGTPENAGLVLGLDRGGSCAGKVFKVCVNEKEQVSNYLYARELATTAYLARIIKVHTKDGRILPALTFVVDTQHRQYTSGKSPEQLANIARKASGLSGKSSDYLISTLKYLRQSGIHDSRLESIAALL